MKGNLICKGVWLSCVYLLLDKICICPDSPEEGEVRSPKRPRLPKGSPPPENEWAPCVRLLVTESDCLERGSLYVATINGVNIGRLVEI